MLVVRRMMTVQPMKMNSVNPIGALVVEPFNCGHGLVGLWASGADSGGVLFARLTQLECLLLG